jgi:sigma-E factor negative regulatory protein RseB
MFTNLQVEPDSLGRLAGIYKASPAPESAPPAAAQLGWAFSMLPKGFELDLHELKPSARGADQVEHFLLSDGLASLSVFVERGGADEALQGGARMGAVSAWGGQVAGHQVTVVGDVPLDTVRQVLQGLRPNRNQP